jgi:Na+-driven multidrug efflux pump
MTWSFTSLILFRVVGITLYDHFAEITLIAIWMFMTIDIFVQAIVFATISFKGKWRETSV